MRMWLATEMECTQMHAGSRRTECSAAIYMNMLVYLCQLESKHLMMQFSTTNSINAHIVLTGVYIYAYPYPRTDICINVLSLPTFRSGWTHSRPNYYMMAMARFKGAPAHEGVVGTKDLKALVKILTDVQGFQTQHDIKFIRKSRVLAGYIGI